MEEAFFDIPLCREFAQLDVFGRLLGMMPHIGVDAESGLAHTVRGTPGNVVEVSEGNSLLHGQDSDVLGDAGYQLADKRPGAQARHKWHVAIKPGKCKKLDNVKLTNALIDKVEEIKADIRAKGKRSIRVVNRQLRFVKVRYRRLKKTPLQLTTLFTLSNLWMVRSTFMGMQT